MQTSSLSSNGRNYCCPTLHTRDLYTAAARGARGTLAARGVNCMYLAIEWTC